MTAFEIDYDRSTLPACFSSGRICRMMIEAANHREILRQNLRRQEKGMIRFKSAAQCQRFVSNHGPISNLFVLHHKHQTAAEHHELRTVAMAVWREIALSNVA
ncbi:hypothetical protein GOZ97_04440 [Agrobacterium vitis]|nr:hypothetical protein [Allorhizobium ampelinum]MUO87859.1 hypothetical protein [Agrobacterium vitis]MUZ51012.1 hypothetical protein [Agrobacterium vitis]MUZ90661.1 hypothetical protein [Agrobacterium vitis]MVA38607.1 hypothetical protein [Agrobacterium vitis]